MAGSCDYPDGQNALVACLKLPSGKVMLHDKSPKGEPDVTDSEVHKICKLILYILHNVERI